MHNIRTNFRKFYSICKELFEKEVNSRHNFQCYPVAPKMNDLQIVSLSCCMEALGIDSENLLWSKLKTDYADQFTNLIDRSRFNRRRKRLAEKVERVQHHIGRRLDHLSSTMIVDSVPVPVIKMVRERTFKSFKHDFDTAPAKGYSAVNRSWFIGYKLHVIIYDNGAIQQAGITKANVHDINFLKQLDRLPAKKSLLGDRAYISQTVQMDLFDNYQVRLKVPLRHNQHDYRKYPRKNRSKRQMVETVFSQLCDHLNLRRNYARSFDGLATRLASKLSATSLLQYINFKNGLKISKIKHALAF
ncbi:IS982 family transposase [Chitinophaga caeni]|uniref:IS982 family transposase n=1 Tax=Chitinophaga caeni TaxID=2029983 RepID=A0A291QY04_9BACT|nr:IS982 family transposase [Chitinophaga caeni]ATL48909.1 IS982 family transposase [Chitinophaga caeni]